MYRCENKMVTLNDLRTCENCGNVFSKKTLIKTVNRCPACNVWKNYLKKLLHQFIHHNIEKKHHWWKEQ